MFDYRHNEVRRDLALDATLIFLEVQSLHLFCDLYFLLGLADLGYLNPKYRHIPQQSRQQNGNYQLVS